MTDGTKAGGQAGIIRILNSAELRTAICDRLLSTAAAMIYGHHHRMAAWHRGEIADGQSFTDHGLRIGKE